MNKLFKTLFTLFLGILLFILTFTANSVADVKNLPVICKKTEGKIDINDSRSYVLNTKELVIAKDKLFKNPSLILESGFINHVEAIKNQKCPSGSKKVFPYTKKSYEQDKLKVNKRYTNILRDWSRREFSVKYDDYVFFFTLYT